MKIPSVSCSDPKDDKFYFNFWDRICGTNFPNYDEYFEGVVARRRASKLARPAAGMEAMQRPAA